MTDAIRAFISVYLMAIACAFGLVSIEQGNFESQASRLDLKVMTLELKGQSSVIDRMGVLRNHTRAKAVKMEQAVRLLAIALPVAATALVIAWLPVALMLMGVSMVAVVGSWWFIWTALL
jgi:hypothetical protein